MEKAVSEMVRTLVVRAPGTNCEHETAYALERAGAQAEIVHVWRVIEKPALLDPVKLLVIPGGFSYGDDLGAGRLLANELRMRLRESLLTFIRSRRCILGICNGFQVLTTMGLLPASEGKYQPEAALVMNDSGRYEDRWVRLRFNRESPAPFKTDDPVFLPVAHAEGKFMVKSQGVLDRLVHNHQILAQYDGDNPNGSVQDIAAVTNKHGNVIGIMPHPERYVTTYQHPAWTRMKNPHKGEGDGLRLFRRLIDYLRRHG